MANKSKTIAGRRSRAALTWIDFLVIAAIILTFAAIVSTTLARAKAATHNDRDAPTFSNDVGQIDTDPGLIKARIRLAAGAPWG